VWGALRTLAHTRLPCGCGRRSLRTSGTGTIQISGQHVKREESRI